MEALLRLAALALGCDLLAALRRTPDGTAAVTAAVPPGRFPSAMRLRESPGRAVRLETARPGRLLPTALALALGDEVRASALLPLDGDGLLLAVWLAPNDPPADLEARAAHAAAALTARLDAKARDQAVAALAARFDAIMATVPQALVFVEEAGDGLLNPPAARLLELEPGWVAPEPLRAAMDALRRRGPPDLAERAAAMVGEPDFQVFDWRWELLADGEHPPRSLRVASVPVRSNAIRGRLWVFDDIGALAAAQRELTARNRALAEAHRQAAAAADRAEAASEAKSRFVAMMSHELRTPLTGIMGMLDLLRATPLDAAQRGYAETAVRSAGALLAVLNDVLDFAKIEAGRMTFEALAFDPAALLREATALFAAPAGKALTLGCSCGPGVPAFVTGDPLRLRQVLINLLGNALKFTEAGRIEARLDAIGGRLRFAVSDTGIGIPAALQGRLFEAFVQADASTARTHGGSGLGLSICKRLVEAMGGEIGVESAPGRGSTFWFTLPLRTAEAPAEVAPTTPDAAPPAVVPCRILVAEDNPTNRLLLTAMLGRRGHAVTAVEDGAAAVAAVARERFDVVLMDMQMPELDGMAAARRIRALPAPACDVALIALTAEAQPDDRARHMAAGLDGHVTKPIDWAALDLAIATAVTARGRNGAPRPQAEPAPALPDIDATALAVLRRSLGPESFARLVRTFLGAAGRDIAEMAAAASLGDTATLHRAAHSLRGAAGNLAACRLAALAGAIEAADPAAALPLVSQLDDALMACALALGEDGGLAA